MELWKTRRREILAGGIVLLVIAAVCYFLPAQEQPRAAEDIAVMRISEVLTAHPSYARLMELRAEEATLALAVRDVPEVFSLTPPAADDEPFQDSVWQKNAQTVIGARVELERERKRLTEVYRKQTEDDYERRKKQIDDEYQNAITNINLKLDNQRAMHGPRVSEDELAQERAGLEAQREALRQERGARQAELYRTWQEEIRAAAGDVDGKGKGNHRRTEGGGGSPEGGGGGTQRRCDGTRCKGAGRTCRRREARGAPGAGAPRCRCTRGSHLAGCAQPCGKDRTDAAPFPHPHRPAGGRCGASRSRTPLRSASLYAARYSGCGTGCDGRYGA